MSFYQPPKSFSRNPTNSHPKYPPPSVVTPPLSGYSDSSESISPHLHYARARRSTCSCSCSRQGPFELSATPVHHRSLSTRQRGSPDQHPFQDWRNVLKKKIDDLDQKITSTIRTLEILGLQNNEHTTMFDEILHCISNLQPTTLPFPPPRAPPLPSVPLSTFIQTLPSYLLPYTASLDPVADYAVASTTNPRDKRCRVGRPRGKILRADQTDDLERELCSKHKDEEGTRLRVAAGEDAWACYPVNKDEGEK